MSCPAKKTHPNYHSPLNPAPFVYVCVLLCCVVLCCVVLCWAVLCRACVRACVCVCVCAHTQILCLIFWLDQWNHVRTHWRIVASSLVRLKHFVKEWPKRFRFGRTADFWVVLRLSLGCIHNHGHTIPIPNSGISESKLGFYPGVTTMSWQQESPFIVSTVPTMIQLSFFHTRYL